MKKLLAALLCAMMTTHTHAVPIDFVVTAATDRIASPLDTGISFSLGDTLLVSADSTDLWNAGPLPRWSNADGLIGDLFATGTDESGQTAGTLIGQNFGTFTSSGLAAPYGALVGLIDSTYFVLGTNFSGVAPASGTLSLMYWDSNYRDNSESITVSVDDGTPPAQVSAPGAPALLALGLLALGLRARRRS